MARQAARKKISPAFDPFLEESGPNDKQDAIVIYQAPISGFRPEQSQMRERQTRLEYVEERAAVQKLVQERLFDSYRTEGAKRWRGEGQLRASAIGASSLPIATVEVTRRTLPALAKEPDVVAIMPNQKIRLIAPSQIEYADLSKRQIEAGVTWGIDQLEIPRIWEKVIGTDINIAVLDTGVHGDHPVLAGRVKKFVVVDPLGRRIRVDRAFDSNQHGTHVCGTIAGGKTGQGVAVGVAPGVNLLVGGVLVGDATLRTLMEGISWAVEAGADIINMSLGFSYYEPLFAALLDILIEQFGIMPVVAVGNTSHGSTCSPGNAHSAFSVGAVEQAGRGKVDVAFFSSGASLVFPGSAPIDLVTKPDVVAPGVDVYSCIPPEKRASGTFEYSFMSGTSMAAPHVAGVAALLMESNPKAPVPDIIEVMKETAHHPGGADMRPDNRWGYGMIDPSEAIRALRS